MEILKTKKNMFIYNIYFLDNSFFHQKVGFIQNNIIDKYKQFNDYKTNNILILIKSM